MKIASIHPPNLTRAEPLPAEDAAFAVIDEDSKRISAILDGAELTRWKTAADSALGSRILSRPDSETLLVLGAGPIAAALAEAHVHVRPAIRRILLWNRSPDRLAEMRRLLGPLQRELRVESDLPGAVRQADIITSATGSREPLIRGEDVRPGTHVDLVGGYTPDMREADDQLVAKADVHVNFRASAIGQVGDICQPISNGTISEKDIRGDLFDLVGRDLSRRLGGITLYKNAGGAYMDLLVARAYLNGQ
ncbi:ornithine cyclodeaminase family protein [Pseudogemmobacter humi]|nr:ornithine cyclodeaminase [Pseudogemmobacter humi]